MTRKALIESFRVLTVTPSNLSRDAAPGDDSNKLFSSSPRIVKLLLA